MGNISASFLISDCVTNTQICGFDRFVFFFQIDNVFGATHETGRLKRNHQVARLLWNSRVHECPKLAAITRRNTNVTRLHGHQTRCKRARTSFARECERLPSSVRVPLRRLATHFPVRKQSKCGEGGSDNCSLRPHGTSPTADGNDRTLATAQL